MANKINKENEIKDINEEDYKLAFQIITYAGDAASSAMESIEASSEYKFDDAERLIKLANKSYIDCHQIQTDMFTNEANGKKNDVNILLVHAQDHITMANLKIEAAKQMLKLYRKIYELESQERRDKDD